MTLNNFCIQTFLQIKPKNLWRKKAEKFSFQFLFVYKSVSTSFGNMLARTYSLIISNARIVKLNDRIVTLNVIIVKLSQSVFRYFLFFFKCWELCLVCFVVKKYQKFHNFIILKSLVSVMFSHAAKILTKYTQ